MIEEAAALRGQPTSFVLTTVIERARELLRQAEATLSARDRAAFLRIVDQTEPRPALVKAARRFRKRHVG
ncbi:MAG: DUF1778 domain-containing protein [Deltaproteobacteria bacterium]|nr:DUF1778 domain-containing protein [Deltaproteobacteria bacterium]